MFSFPAWRMSITCLVQELAGLWANSMHKKWIKTKRSHWVTLRNEILLLSLGQVTILAAVTCFKFCLLMPTIPTQNHKRESEVIYTAELQTQGTQGRTSNVALQFPAAWSPSALCFGLCIIPLCQHKHLYSCTENWIQEFIHVKTISFFFFQKTPFFFILFFWGFFC